VLILYVPPPGTRDPFHRIAAHWSSQADCLGGAAFGRAARRLEAFFMQRWWRAVERGHSLGLQTRPSALAWYL